MLDPRAMQDLHTRIDAEFPPGRGRLIGFIASGTGEGTSSVALAYARCAATQMRRRVLLLDAASASIEPPVSGVGSLLGALSALADRLDTQDPAARGAAPAAGAFAPQAAAPHTQALWELLPRADLWMALRESFDEVVIDLPCAAHSRLGLAVAPYCDGVALVVQAERTRSPVAESLVAHLRMVRARVMGAVMNRRRFYLPQAVYRLL
jgi:Mrp family chromosome partitioning ATPase